MLKKLLLSITFVLFAVISSVKPMEERPKISKKAYPFTQNYYNFYVCYIGPTCEKNLDSNFAAAFKRVLVNQEKNPFIWLTDARIFDSVKAFNDEMQAVYMNEALTNQKKQGIGLGKLIKNFLDVGVLPQHPTVDVDGMLQHPFLKYLHANANTIMNEENDWVIKVFLIGFSLMSDHTTSDACRAFLNKLFTLDVFNEFGRGLWAASEEIINCIERDEDTSAWYQQFYNNLNALNFSDEDKGEVTRLMNDIEEEARAEA